MEYGKKELEFARIWLVFKENLWRAAVIFFCSAAVLSAVGAWKAVAARSAPASGGELPDVSAAPVVLTAKDGVYLLSQEERDRYYERILREMYAWKQYHDESLRLRLDAMAVPTARVVFLISGATQETSWDNLLVANRYLLELEKEEFYEALREETGLETDDRYLKELITSLIKQGLADETATSSSLLTFRIISPDRETSESLGGALVSYLEQKASDIAAQTASHSLTLVDCTFVIEADATLAAEQRNSVNKLLYYIGSGTAEAMGNSMRLVTDTRVNTVTVARQTGFRIFLPYLMAGIALGGVCAAAWVLFKAVLDERVLDWGQLGHNYRIKLLEAARYRTGGGNGSALEAPLFLYDLETNLSRFTGKELLLVSPDTLEVPQSWQGIFDKLNIRLKAVPFFLDDVANLKFLKETDLCLLVCRRYRTTYQEADDILRRALEAGAAIAGIMVRG
ncbi:MAG: hypothetical protein LBQ15_06205 [Clostridium sp.]|jgi:hypothetical protein|nr:hypothetical protein [Clostridium sp.]